MSISRLIGLGLLLILPSLAFAQQTAFGSGQVDPDQPVEVESDELKVSETDGTAEFLGNVVIVQGEMRLAAPRVLVVYDEEGERIKRLEATGGVTLVSGEDAAEAQRADYDIDGGQVVMTGDVLLVQGKSTLESQRMVVDLNGGTAQMEGRVRTILNQKKD
ncbi:organic solvent tolerance protein OstA [Primorskyibacter flagellatus]|uniref:Organic solvent tolerance protein OstA n=1 Tax=Primorskyibacter flagellatus TaxID=1387277 RepID=A0A917EIE7_9RHOB|nr:lipopolysaccharide transport periplasmic protein LptA [Primorskyibacter flagellatus]GGE44674.1 organic solvent tolerance protein OstA [Primorskyibacter flagellatus]